MPVTGLKESAKIPVNKNIKSDGQSLQILNCSNKRF